MVLRDLVGRVRVWVVRRGGGRSRVPGDADCGRSGTGPAGPGPVVRPGADDSPGPGTQPGAETGPDVGRPGPGVPRHHGARPSDRDPRRRPGATLVGDAGVRGGG